MTTLWDEHMTWPAKETPQDRIPVSQPSNREIMQALRSVEFVLAKLRDAVEERIRREEDENGLHD